MCAKIIAVVRDRTNGDPVEGETVTFRNPGGSSLATDDTNADGSATYSANGNPAGIITWDVDVSGDTRKASGRATRQIGPFFESELAKTFKGVMSNGYSEGDGSECAVIPGAGRQVVVGTGCLWVEGVPFHFYTTTPLASSANPGTFATRLDRVILRVELDDSATDYGMGTLVYLEGTVNNTLPSITQDEAGTYEYVLANVTSASGFSSYTGGNISDQRAQAGPNAIPVANLPTGIPAENIGNGSVSTAEFQYLATAASDLQAQITALTAAIALKAPINNAVLTGTVGIPDAALAIADTSGLQAALDAKASSSSPTLTNPTLSGTVTVTDGALAIADTNGLQTALNAKLSLDGGTMTGALVVNHEILGDVTSQNAFILRKADDTEIVRVDTQNGSFNIFQGADLVLLSDSVTPTFRVDGATGDVTVGGATLTAAELARVDGVTSNIQTQLDARASKAGATFTGDLIGSNGLHHTGGTWGFNGSSVSGKQSDPADIGTGTIDATWGTTEAAILEDIRTNVNDLKTMLRAVGMITA